MKYIVGIIAFLLLIAASALFVVPGTFGLIHGLFDNNDIGTIAGIIVAIIVAGLCFQVSALTAIFLAAFVGD